MQCGSWDAQVRSVAAKKSETKKEEKGKREAAPRASAGRRRRELR